MTTMCEPTRAEYRRLRRDGWNARVALDYARALLAWGVRESDDVVRLRAEPDDDPRGALDYLDQDCFNDTSEARHGRAHVIRLAENDGVWGYIAEYLCPQCGQWMVLDSLWGVIGDPWSDANRSVADTVRMEAMANLPGDV